MTKDKEDKFVPMGTKISPDAAVVWDAICQAHQTDTYHMLQNFIYTMIRAAADPHGLNPTIESIITMLETDSGWQSSFNLANPDQLRVAQVVLILEQDGHKGFGAVMVDKPFVDNAIMTECADDILERVCEVTMKGIYRRLRVLGGKMGCQNLSDLLLTMIDAQTVLHLDEEERNEMRAPGNFTDSGREYTYGKKTKSIHHKGVDMYDRQTTIRFTYADRQQADDEVDRSSHDLGRQLEDETGVKPFGGEW